MLRPEHIAEISALLKGRIALGAPLSALTGFRIGGPAELVAEPETIEELVAVAGFARTENLPLYILGGGTNVLCPDSGLRGVVIRTVRVSRIEMDPDSVGVFHIDCGTPLAKIVAMASREGWAGLEALWGIPGAFGGAVAGNAGAHGVSIGDFLESITTLGEDGRRRTIPARDLRYGYRTMELPPGAIALSGALRLTRTDPTLIRERLTTVIRMRKATNPGRPSAGCVFKNPGPSLSAGKIIDSLGFKGATVGDAQVSPVHANFIVNMGRASAHDVLCLIQIITERVQERFGIALAPEIRIIRESGPTI
jgi:UDP-N-acetylmuramate dehydrogenase